MILFLNLKDNFIFQLYDESLELESQEQVSEIKNMIKSFANAGALNDDQRKFLKPVFELCREKEPDNNGYALDLEKLLKDYSFEYKSSSRNNIRD